MKITIVKGTLKSVEEYKNLEGKRVVFLKETQARDPQPPKGMPKWFKVWSETVYQNQQPQWFKTWSDTEFKPLVDKVNEQGERLDKINNKVTNIDNKLERVIKLNNLKS